MQGSTVTRLKGGAPGGSSLATPSHQGWMWGPSPSRCVGLRGVPVVSGALQCPPGAVIPGWSREGPAGRACWVVAPAGREGPGSARAAAPAPIPNKEPMQTQGSGVAVTTRGHPGDVGGTAGAWCSLVPGDPRGHHMAFVPHEDEGTWDTIPAGVTKHCVTTNVTTDSEMW
ncbi:unnamed protein product [Coccothraustes coccothraustes]